MLPDSLGVELDLGRLRRRRRCFRWLAETGGVGEAEMLRTFNCGIGMVAFAAAASEAETMRELDRQGPRADADRAAGRRAGRSASRCAGG